MKDSSTHQVVYDGSLKELAKAHAGLVNAVLFVFILPLPLLSLGLFLEFMGHDGTEMTTIAFGCIFLTSVIVAVVWLFWRCRKLARLLFPHVATLLSFAAIIPLLSFCVAFFLWVSAIRQLRARGLQVGALGIDPGKLEG